MSRIITSIPTAVRRPNQLRNDGFIINGVVGVIVVVGGGVPTATRMSLLSRYTGKLFSVLLMLFVSFSSSGIV